MDESTPNPGGGWPATVTERSLASGMPGGVLDTVLEFQEGVQVGHAVGKLARRVADAMKLLPVDRRRLDLVGAIRLDLGSNHHQPHRSNRNAEPPPRGFQQNGPPTVSCPGCS